MRSWMMALALQTPRSQDVCYPRLAIVGRRTNGTVSAPNCTTIYQALIGLCISRRTKIRILWATFICTVWWLTGVSVPKAPRQSCENTILSQTLFPVSHPEQTNSWIGENHKTLQALLHCMELSNCGPNQKQGARLL